MATFLQSLHNLFLFNLIDQMNAKLLQSSFCNIPHPSNGCANQICENLICSTHPECCSSSWDINCSTIACKTPIHINGITQRGLCQSIHNACPHTQQACDLPHHTGGCQSIQCTNKICNLKPECCDNQWDQSCTNLACNIHSGLCNEIVGACLFESTQVPIIPALLNRHLLQTSCSNDPCPGNQYRNPNTCLCECHNSHLNSCNGNQIFSDVLCECGCAIAPTCITPKTFNTLDCACECPTNSALLCTSNQQFDTDTCQCIPICPLSDPCPGLQQRNPTNCQCQCPNPLSCPGNQHFNDVSCDCQCPITPTCIAPQTFNAQTCECECNPDIICDTHQIFNTDTCQCQDTLICPSDPCPGGIQTRNAHNCECECANENVIQCVGNQEFNILCECQCATTPICSVLQEFDPITCECECTNPVQCTLPNTFDTDSCECVPPTVLCSPMNDPCPGNQLRDTHTCECECGNTVICEGKQEFNVFCECGCPVTPICKAPKWFNAVQCQCECPQRDTVVCAGTEVFNTDTCQCARVITAIPTVTPTRNPSQIPTSMPSHSPTNIPTIFPSQNPSNTPSVNPTDFPSMDPSVYPSVSPTHIPTVTPTLNPSLFPSTNPSKAPSINPTQTPSVNPSYVPSVTPSINPTISLRMYAHSKTFICEIEVYYDILMQYLHSENILINAWAQAMIGQTVHFGDPIISNNIHIRIIRVSNILLGVIVIEYSIEYNQVEIFDILLDHIDSAEIVYSYGETLRIIDNDVIETEHPTTLPSPAPMHIQFGVRRKLLMKIEGEYSVLSQYMAQQSTSMDTWAYLAVQSLIRYNDPIIHTNTVISIDFVYSDMIAVEYTLDISNMETFDIIMNNIDNTQLLIVGNYMFNIISNEIIRDTTVAPVDMSQYWFEKTFVFRVSGDISYAYLTAQNIALETWANEAVQALIHYHSNDMIQSNTIIVVNAVDLGDIAVEYTLKMKNSQVFEIILNIIDNTHAISVRGHMFALVSNEILSDHTPVSGGVECVGIAQICNAVTKCCNSDVICMAENGGIGENSANGICCMDYGQLGCVSDSDCCYANSYCDSDGMCQRNKEKNELIYDASDSKEETEVSVGTDKQVEGQSNIADLSRFQNAERLSVKKWNKLSPIIKIVLFVSVALLGIANMMFCCGGRCWKSKEGNTGNDFENREYDYENENENENVYIF